MNLLSLQMRLRKSQQRSQTFLLGLPESLSVEKRASLALTMIGNIAA
jgi:hypothetical protein